MIKQYKKFLILLTFISHGSWVLSKKPAIESATAHLFDQDQIPTELQTTPRKMVAPVDEERIEFNFEDADLDNLLIQVQDIFGVMFITDDIVQPMKTGAKPVKGNKFSFKTHRPLSREEAWNLFLTFLDVAGLMTVPDGAKRYRVMATEAARRAPVPAYIGTEYQKLPENDQLIRYVYFIQNSSLETIAPIVDSLRSTASGFFRLNDLNAFVLTDKSFNIRSLMKIVHELDRVTMPQAMSIMQLRYIDAEDAKKIYESLLNPDAKVDQNVTARLFPQRKPQTTSFFPDNARIIAEPRTNRLILLGPKESLKKIENFIRYDLDKEVEKPYSPLRAYPLKYANAATIADIMNSMVSFGKDTTKAGAAGGVRGRDKYFKPMIFTAEPETNSLIVKGDEEDFLRALPIIEQLDAPQAQVAIEVLILSIRLQDDKGLGSQIRSKRAGANGLLGNNVAFQTSGLNMGGQPTGILQNTDGPGLDRLLADMVLLISSAGATAGNTILTLGSDKWGVWGIFDVIDKLTDTQIVANPFIVTLNNSPATVSVGETRRVVSSIVVSTAGQDIQSFQDDAANLTLAINPQINSDGMISLDITVTFDQFTSPVSVVEQVKQTKKVQTSTILSDKEVLAIGGLIVNRTINNTTKVPVLGDLPIVGWLFKNKTQQKVKDNLLVLTSTRVIKPEVSKDVMAYTQGHIDEYYKSLDITSNTAEQRDPINRWYFAQQDRTPEYAVDKFLLERHEREVKRINKASPPSLETVEPLKATENAPMPQTPVALPTSPAVAKTSRKSLAELVEDPVPTGVA